MTFNQEEVLVIAQRIEENGEKFYSLASKVVKNKQLSSLLDWLAQEEHKHYETFTTMRQELQDNPKWWDPDEEVEKHINAIADLNVFKYPFSIETIVKDIKSPEHAIYIALGFEKDSIIYYLSLLQGISQKNVREREQINKIIYIEMDHIYKLNDILKTLNNYKSNI